MSKLQQGQFPKQREQRIYGTSSIQLSMATVMFVAAFFENGMDLLPFTCYINEELLRHHLILAVVLSDGISFVVDKKAD
eukprot:scaffold7353_cov87-Cylindrotheca_fusiformis.AAC.1